MRKYFIVDCCLLSALLSCLICGIYAKYDDNLHGPLIEPPTFEGSGATIETTTPIEELGTTTETTKNDEKPGTTTSKEYATTTEEPGKIAETTATEETGTTIETTTTDEPATTFETTIIEEPATTTQQPVTMNQQIESFKFDAETMIETTTTEEPATTDTTTTDTTTTDTTTTDTTTIDTTTTDTTTIDTTTTDTTTADTTTTDTTTTDTTTTTTTVSSNNNPCPTDPVPENLTILTNQYPLIYRKSSDCSYLKSGTILVDAHHCRRYYVCNVNRAIRLRCSTNEWYDRQKLKCRHRSLVRNCLPNRN